MLKTNPFIFITREALDHDSQYLDPKCYMTLRKRAEEVMRKSMKLSGINAYEVTIVPGDHNEVVVLVDIDKAYRKKLFDYLTCVLGAPDGEADIRLNDHRRLMKYVYNRYEGFHEIVI